MSAAALVLEYGALMQQLIGVGIRSVTALADELDLTTEEVVELAQELLNRGRLTIAPLP